MVGSKNSSLVVCYISGFDLRRIQPTTTPFLSQALSDFPWAEFINVPSNELFPTLVTGVDPTQHKVWGVKLKQPANSTFAARLIDSIPNILTTTMQCCLHLATSTFDLAAIPPRRRRRFKITRTKYKRRKSHSEALYEIGGVDSIFDVVGHKRSCYIFYAGYDPVRRLLPRLVNNGCLAEIVELYSLDRFQQWHLDRPETVLEFYSMIDDFLRQLHDKCQRAGKTLMVVSDHGHEPIRESLDILKRLRELPLPEDTYTYFVEVSSVRFWFHSQEARQVITTMLSDLKCGSLLTYQEMAQYGIPLKDDKYGEFFYFLNPGFIFFPHDFHHSLANLWLGLVDRIQRNRLRDPCHKGNHGYLPHFDTERSFIALMSSEFHTNGTLGHILDVAPTILAVLGFDPPASMRGRSLFREKRQP